MTVSTETAADRSRSPLMTAAGYAAMVLFVLLIAVPLLWIVITSFKERQDIYAQPAQWWPNPATSANYHTVVTSIPFPTFFRNSVIMTGTLAASRVDAQTLKQAVESTIQSNPQVTSTAALPLRTECGWGRWSAD